MSSEAHYLPRPAEDVATEVLLGAVCGECGSGFVATHGHPVLCRYCWTHTDDRTGYQRATHDEHSVAIGKSRSRAKRTTR